MALYPKSIGRCQHIKINGTQCASPSLRRGKFCYFHQEWRPTRLVIGSGGPALGNSNESNSNQTNSNPSNSTQSNSTQTWEVTLPVLEDANSIQMGVLEVMRLLLTRRVDPRTAGLLLYALQTASANLARTTFEPELPTQVVIDEKCVEHRPIGATAWSITKGKKYDAVKADPEVRSSGWAKSLIDQLGLVEEIPEEMRRDLDERAETETQETRRGTVMQD